MEEWRTVNDFTTYEVSNKGRVRNSKTRRIMKTSINKKGYETVCLREFGIPRTKLIHRLVAEAFLDDVDGLDVAHADSNRSNNNLYNLKIKTRAKNMQEIYRNGRKQIHRMKKVKCVETGEVFGSIVECAEAMGTSPQAVSRCVNNPALSNKDGYHFRPI